MKKLCGLVCLSLSVLLGVALVAPLPSEAISTPSVKISIDGGNVVELISGTTCTAVAPYNLCFLLKIGSTTNITSLNPNPTGSDIRTYQVVNATSPAGSVAKLLINDTDGSDLITLTGLRVEPLNPVGSLGTKLTTSSNWGCAAGVTATTNCENGLDLHKIKILSVVTLNHGGTTGSNGGNSSANFSLALNTGGNFYPGPPVLSGTTAYNIINDQIDFNAWGIFKSGDNTLNGGRGQSMTSGKYYKVVIGTTTVVVQKSGLMTYQYGGPVSGSSNYQLTQLKYDYDGSGTTTNDSFPTYTGCVNALSNNKCAPTITQEWVATVKGGDSFELQSSNDLVAVGCSTSNNAGGAQTPQGPPCFSNSKKQDATDDIDAALIIITNNNSSAALEAGSVPGTTCEELNNCECLSDDCRGTIVVAAEVTPAVRTSCTQPNSIPPGFPFTGTGPLIAIPGDTPFPLPFCIETDNKGKGSIRFPNLFIGNSDPWSFTANITSLLWPKPDSTHEYDPDNIDCSSVLNQPAVIDPTTGQVITPAVIVSAWNFDTGSVKTTATVTELGKGDTVTCTYHIHKKGGN